MANQEAAQDKTTVSVSTYQERIKSLLEANNAEVQRKQDALAQVVKLTHQLESVSLWYVQMDLWLAERPEDRAVELTKGATAMCEVRLHETPLDGVLRATTFEADSWWLAWSGAIAKFRKLSEIQLPKDTN